MEVGDVFGLLIVVVGLVSLIIYLSRRSFALQEKKLETEARLAALLGGWRDRPPAPFGNIRRI